MATVRSNISQAIAALKKIQDVNPLYKGFIAELEKDRERFPPANKPKEPEDTDQSAADDYLDYLHNQW